MKKKYKCEYPECEKETQIRTKIKNRDSEYFGLNVCPYHANLEKAPKVKSDQTRRTEKARAEQRKDYPEFYQKWCEKVKGWHCVECGNIVQGNSTNIAHVLAKSTSPEVATNDMNIIVLCDKHHFDFDKSLDSRSQMKCFQKSVLQYTVLKPLLKNITSETIFYENNLCMSK